MNIKRRSTPLKSAYSNEISFEITAAVEFFFFWIFFESTFLQLLKKPGSSHRNKRAYIFHHLPESSEAFVYEGCRRAVFHLHHSQVGAHHSSRILKEPGSKVVVRRQGV
ncbi:hypothetical protein TorRG33x02_206140 [Trema orientale]|uniref:Uncharacterized protein n=1 Tax=Trema orientale TaxID=63057 RepID=A0A2P5EDF1_TREOI|nr:hypothetical protein TorRG33x02_206140 [Trema orientale]